MLLSAQRSLNARAYTRGARAVPAAHPVQHAARVSRTPMRVQSLRVANTEIPNGKRLEISLQYILGIGQTKAREIVGNTGIENKKIYELSEEEINAIREEVGKHTTESDLRRMNTLNIKRLRDIGCYRGRRHLMGLPVRGQRTKTNSRTRKGKRKTVANKKK